MRKYHFCFGVAGSACSLTERWCFSTDATLIRSLASPASGGMLSTFTPSFVKSFVCASVRGCCLQRAVRAIRMGSSMGSSSMPSPSSGSRLSMTLDRWSSKLICLSAYCFDVGRFSRAARIAARTIRCASDSTRPYARLQSIGLSVIAMGAAGFPSGVFRVS